MSIGNLKNIFWLFCLESMLSVYTLPRRCFNLSNKKFNGKYVALILALVLTAGGLTVYFTRQSGQKAEQAALEEPMVENLAANTQSTQPSSTPAPSSASPSAAAPSVSPEAASQPSQSTEAPAARTALKTGLPVAGDAIGAYAMDCLSYNETTRDWRVHNGTDYAAEMGTPVCAAADGTVYTTYEDDTLGYTVVIRHDGGYTTRYSSLSEDLCVAPGDTVTLGQTIGYASDTALVESVMGAHVHFSVSCQDQPMDPAEFFALG